jgi:6-phosphogluconolactonase (cycloisomerase 2 family)
MKILPRIGAGLALGAASGLALFTSAATAAPSVIHHVAVRNVVFVQTDNLAGNHVVAYNRAADGQLSFSHSYATGGKGGALKGSVVDHQASQGSLAFDPKGRILIALNARSNSVSVFSVAGDQLRLRQVISSRGRFPVSVAVHGDLAYVLNAKHGGSVAGFRESAGHLTPIAGSARRLGLDATATPQFVNTPGQVAFTPSGKQLLVTTKANGNDIDVFRVNALGKLSPHPQVNTETGTVPFAVAWTKSGKLVVAEAGTNALATFKVGPAGTVTPIDAVATSQAATCWVVKARGHFFASNAGSGSLSRFSSTGAGQLTLLGQTTTDPGTVDAAATRFGHYLYVQTGAKGIVDGYRVGVGGTLTMIGATTVPGAVAGEGIVAF